MRQVSAARAISSPPCRSSSGSTDPAPSYTTPRTWVSTSASNRSPARAAAFVLRLQHLVDVLELEPHLVLVRAGGLPVEHLRPADRIPAAERHEDQDQRQHPRRCDQGEIHRSQCTEAASGGTQCNKPWLRCILADFPGGIPT